MMKILIVEDEPKTSAYVRQGLSEVGFVVDVAGDGDAGLAAAREESYSLILCDLMLPKRDGLSLIAELRRSGRQTPVICVTARADVDSRVRGRDVGADDYLVKPFAFAELLARIRALLRRAAAGPSELFRVADLVCDPRTRRVERGDRRIELTPKEFVLLHFLLEHAGDVVPRTLIADRVWNMNFDSDTNLIDVQIRRLRAKIDTGETVPLIHTVRGVGYMLADRGGSGA